MLQYFFVMAFFHTKVYLLAFASILVPSIKIVSPDISPKSKRIFETSARIRLEQGAKLMLLNRASVAWSGAECPSRRNMKLISLLQFSSGSFS